MESVLEMLNLTKSILYDLEKGNISYEDEKFQLFLPIGLAFANFDLLRAVAENTLIEEDNAIVQDFISKIESIIEVNQNYLTNAFEETLKFKMRDL